MLIEKSSSKQSLFSLVIVTCRLCDEKIWTLTKAWEAFGYSNGLLLGQFQFDVGCCDFARLIAVAECVTWVKCGVTS